MQGLVHVADQVHEEFQRVAPFGVGTAAVGQHAGTGG